MISFSCLFNSKDKDVALSSEDESSRMDDENSLSQMGNSSNQLLQIGQNLIKNKQTKRTFEEITRTEITTNDGTHITKSSQLTASANNENASESYLEKFSFLKKDKTYLSRISSYVSKTLNVNNGLGGGNSIKPELKKSRNMVFACLSQAPINETVDTTEVIKSSSCIANGSCVLTHNSSCF
jgi:hypothetical protein